MSSRPRLWLLRLLAVAALTAAGAEVRVGDPFPALAAAGLAEGELPVTAGRVVLVDFWASWCEPCKASFPALARLQGDYAARGLVIVAVSVDQKPAAYAGFVRRFKPPFATLRDHGPQLAAAVKVPVMPTSYLLDRQGKVRFLNQGFHGRESEAGLRRQIEQLLAEPR